MIDYMKNSHSCFLSGAAKKETTERDIRADLPSHFYFRSLFYHTERSISSIFDYLIKK